MRFGWLSRVGLTLVTTVSIGAAVAAPAQAAPNGWVSLTGFIVHFTAGSAKQNAVVVTSSGRTVVIDDRVPVKAGRGCTAVKGDRTKVKCTGVRKPTQVSLELGDRNDTAVNKSSVLMAAYGQAGNDRLVSGALSDSLSGGPGNDVLSGNGGNDVINGAEGNDTLYGGTGNDYLFGDAGNDAIVGNSGDDRLFGLKGVDKMAGGAGNDTIDGSEGNGVQVADRIDGGAHRTAEGDHCTDREVDVIVNCER